MTTDRYAELAARFDQLTGARAEQQRLTAARAGLAPQLREAESEVERLTAAWEKEAGDVRRLEGGTSPTRVWASLRGGLADRLTRERAEQEAAGYAVHRAEEQLRRLESEDASIGAALAGLGDVETDYETVLRQVRSVGDEPDAGILRERAATASRLLEDLRWRRELEEAMAAGQEAGKALAAAREHLGTASAWSAYDTFAGGGMLSSLLKHDRLDEATSLLDRAAQALRRFSRELTDVEIPGVEAPLVDGLSRGLDIWFDNFITDLMVSQRITQAKQQVDEAIAAVAATMDQLRDRRARLDASAAGMP